MGTAGKVRAAYAALIPSAGCKCVESEVEAAIELGLLGDGARQLGLNGGALASREAAAAQLGPQLLDVVVKRDHRALLVCVERRGSRGHAGGGRVKDAEGAAKRGAGVPILPDVTINRRAPARSLRPARLGTAHP
jgi:hypothetical protein